MNKEETELQRFHRQERNSLEIFKSGELQKRVYKMLLEKAWEYKKAMDLEKESKDER